MVRSRNEGMLDRPAASRDGLFSIGRFVRSQNLVDGRIADSVSGDAPTQTVELLDDRRIRFLLESVDAVILSAFVIRLRIKLCHPPTLETTVNGQLDAAETQPLVSLVWFYVIRSE